MNRDPGNVGNICIILIFFCEFEIIFKMFKTGSDKKESKDGIY